MCCVVLDYWPRILDNRGKPVHVVVRVGLELMTTGIRVRHSDHSFTLPAYTDKSRYFELFLVPPFSSSLLRRMYTLLDAVPLNFCNSVDASGTRLPYYGVGSIIEPFKQTRT